MAVQVFISYSHDDGVELAHELRDELLADSTLDVSPWLDDASIRPSERWNDAIDEALERADAVIVLITPGAVSSLHVEAEWNAALTLGKKVVALVMPGAAVPRTLGALQFIDMSVPERAKARLRRFLRSIEDELAAREQSATAPTGGGQPAGSVSRPESKESPASGSQPISPHAATPHAIDGHEDLPRGRYSGTRARLAGVLGLVLIAVGNILALLGSSEPFVHWIFDAIGWRSLASLHIAMSVITGVLLLAGYGGAFYWLSRAEPRMRYARTSVLAILGVLLVSGVAMANLYVVAPDRPVLDTLLHQEVDEWSEPLLSRQRTSGGMPVTLADPEAATQVWTTAQSIKARLEDPADVKPDASRIRRAFDYIEATRLQPADGSRDQGYGYLDHMKRWGVTEIAGWVALAYLASLQQEPGVLWRPDEIAAIAGRVDRELRLLATRQHSDGGWAPIDGEGRNDPRHQRSYSAVIAVWALVEGRENAAVQAEIGDRYDEAIAKGLQWLVNTHRHPYGLVPNPTRKVQNEAFPGLNAQMTFVLFRARSVLRGQVSDSDYRRVVNHLLESQFWQRPIGKSERMHDGDRYLAESEFTQEGVTFLWYPWTVLAMAAIAADASLPQDVRTKAADVYQQLTNRTSEAQEFISGEFLYARSEFVFCLSRALKLLPPKEKT